MGQFINLEGGDGSGKKTQTELLVKYARELGLTVGTESYPRYSEPVAEPISRFLNGRYGNPHPALAGLPYSIDRLLGSAAIQEIIAQENSIFITDRFTSSNLGHNGAKFDTPEKRQEYFEFVRNFEHEVLGIPKPDLNIILLVPPEVSQQNIDKKAARNYTDKKRDMHEADVQHLAKAYESYLALATAYPHEYALVDSMATPDRMRSIDDIQQELRGVVRNLLGIS